MILDAGPKTIDLIKDHLDRIQNRDLERSTWVHLKFTPYNTATDAAAEHVAKLTQGG